MPDSHAPAPAAAPWRQSLLFVLTATLAASVISIGALLYGALSLIIGAHFDGLREARLRHADVQARAVITRELESLHRLSTLLAGDAELNNATYYHLYLEGEAQHPAAAVQRIAIAFELPAVILKDMNGQTLGATATAAPLLASPPAAPGIAWAQGSPWLVARATLSRAGNDMAELWLGQPLEAALGAAFPEGGPVRARLHQPGPPNKGNARRVELAAPRPVLLDLEVDDDAGRARAEAQRWLLLLLPFAGLLLAALMGWVLRRQLVPLLALTRAAGEIATGALPAPVSPAGRGEVARLVAAFNAMGEGLSRLRRLERQVQSQEKLAAIGRMAARVAHDINNPLTVIRGLAEINARQAAARGDEILLADQRLTLHHVERCRRTVEALLEHGRPLRLQPEDLDAAALCADIAARWRQAHPEARLELRLPDTTLPVSADPHHLERALDNLLQNAWEAAPDQPLLLSATVENALAVIGVRDGGPGLSAAARAHLFEPFYTSKRGGTGLGLASCLSIAQAHGGTLEASAEGQPSEFRLLLPLRSSATADNPPLPASPAAATAP